MTHSPGPKGMRNIHITLEVYHPQIRESYDEGNPIPEWKINPLCAHILSNKITRLLEKPLKLLSYDGTGDPYEHVEPMYDWLDYYHIHEIIKYKLFVATLDAFAIT